MMNNRRNYIEQEMAKLKALDIVYQCERDVSSKRITGCALHWSDSHDLLMEYYEATEKLADWISIRTGLNSIARTTPCYEDLRLWLIRWNDYL